MDAVEGDNATFECEVTGHPIPDIFWFVNGELVNEFQQRFEISEEATYMTIRDVQV